jgi:hypothetical protein
MKTLAAGPGGTLEAGREYDLDQAQAVTLLEGGYATPVKAIRETATIKPDETAVIPGVAPKIVEAILERYDLVELVAVTDKEFLDIPGLGRATLKAIRAWLAGSGEEE